MKENSDEETTENKQTLENNNIEDTNKIEEPKEEIDPLEIEKNKIQVILKEANKDMSEKNYQKAEQKFSLIIETENKEILEDIKDKMVDILFNYSLSLYHQMKYEQATKVLYDIIMNYDNKNKQAYLLLLKILCNINEYNRAKLLLIKAKKIFDVNEELSEFNEIDNDIGKYFKRKINNIQRQFYYNAQKEIINFRKNLNFFYWCFYSFGALILGHYLSKLLL